MAEPIIRSLEKMPSMPTEITGFMQQDASALAREFGGTIVAQADEVHPGEYCVQLSYKPQPGAGVKSGASGTATWAFDGRDINLTLLLEKDLDKPLTQKEAAKKLAVKFGERAVRELGCSDILVDKIEFGADSAQNYLD